MLSRALPFSVYGCMLAASQRAVHTLACTCMLATVETYSQHCVLSVGVLGTIALSYNSRALNRGGPSSVVSLQHLLQLLLSVVLVLVVLMLPLLVLHFPRCSWRRPAFIAAQMMCNCQNLSLRSW